MNIVENRPKLLGVSELVHPTLVVLMEMIAKEDSAAAGSLFSFNSANTGILDDEDDDEDYSPELDVQRLAQTIIDTMAMAIPSKYFADPALSLIGQVLNNFFYCFDYLLLIALNYSLLDHFSLLCNSIFITINKHYKSNTLKYSSFNYIQQLSY